MKRRARAIVAAALVGAATTTANATTRSPSSSLAVHEASSDAATLTAHPQSHAGRSFVAGSVTFTAATRAWTVGERQAIEAALARLPRAITQRALTVERGGGARCLSDGLPADDEILNATADLARLCDAVATDAVGHLGGSDLDSRAAHGELARKVVLTVLYAFDVATRWSTRDDWRSLNSWRPSITSGWQPVAENVAPGAYANTGTNTATETRATRSPRWDLVAFAAAALLDDQDGDDRIVCRLMSQATFLRVRLAAIGDHVNATAPCEAFDRWANLEQLEDVELILAAPSSAMVGSLFGHLLLRLRYRDENGDTPPDLGRAIAFLADNDTPFTDDPAYALKGIFGKFTASLHERSFLVTYRDYAVVEGRDLRRWRLELSANERRKLLERIWTIRQAGRYRYYFFTRNCATLLVDLVNGALDPERAVVIPGILAAPPSSILERFERARAADGVRPLMTYVPEPIFAFEHQARLASSRRRAAEQRLILASPAALTPKLVAALQRANAPDPTERTAAYLALSPLLARDDVGDPADVYQFLRDSAALESHLSTVANLQAEEQAYAARREKLRQAVTRLDAALRAEARRLLARSEIAARRAGTTLAEALVQMADSDPALRLSGYRQLRDGLPDLTAVAPETATQARLLVLLQSEVCYDVGRMKAVTGLRDDLLFVEAAQPIDQQPYLAAFPSTELPGDARTLLALPSETRVSVPLQTLQQTKQVAFAARGLHPSDQILAGEQDAVAPEVLERAYARSLPRSGIDQFAVLTSIGAHRAMGAARDELDAGLLVMGALYDERLGDHRRFGFPSHTSLVVGRSSLQLTWIKGGPVVSGYDARVLGYRSLSPRLPEAQERYSLPGWSPGWSPGWPLGWELSLDTRGSRAQALAAGVTAAGGLILIVWQRDDLAEHVLATAGLAYEGDFSTGAGTPGAHPQGFGVPVGLEFRGRLGAPDNQRSFWAGRCFARPTWIASGAPARAALQGGASIEAHLALRANPIGGSHDPALLISLQMLRSSQSLRGPGPLTEASLSVGIELR